MNRKDARDAQAGKQGMSESFSHIVSPSLRSLRLCGVFVFDP